ncbi:FliH/SctL family protein [Sanguibacter sp. HDW7]|uniref:FliH/SctL family protein n=1 Tax=Sanguibacter sp. HDW7 TaxID=2714931 RepID=UPI0014096FA7|nr:FliH/SctL family protein [Sanguibacter sp. HDW7]QIK84306.1 hypothetical protein G7063_12285 [Sanguibacter sp. HDW7]
MSAEQTFAPTQLPVVAAARTAEVRERARVAGHAAGWAAGARAAADAASLAAQRVAERAAAAEEDARARLGEALCTLGAASGAAAAREGGVVEDATATVVALALDLAVVVVGVELADDERSARAALARALAVPAPATPVAVRLHPADRALLRELCDTDELALPASVTLVDDASLERGDAVSELPTGHLDARLRPAVERLRTLLEEMLAEGEGLDELLAASGALTRGGAR